MRKNNIPKENLLIWQKHFLKQSHFVRCLALGLLSNSLCGPWTKKFGDPCPRAIVFSRAEKFFRKFWVDLLRSFAAPILESPAYLFFFFQCILLGGKGAAKFFSLWIANPRNLARMKWAQHNLKECLQVTTFLEWFCLWSCALTLFRYGSLVEILLN